MFSKKCFPDIPKKKKTLYEKEILLKVQQTINARSTQIALLIMIKFTYHTQATILCHVLIMETKAHST